MAMLAEPRRRTKWTINPRGKDWANDENKFGQKILEKMGWSKGKGLGRQEQGQVEPVRLSYKNDTQGMGFKGHDDDWLCHRDEFSAMLNELNGTAIQPEVASETVPMKSLEVRSKTSKSRVHYHKFTRGKDLSRYSSQDLACILGKRTTSMLPEENRVDSEEVEGNSSETETYHGLVTIHKGNINDYFAAKMASLKQKPNANEDSNQRDDEDIHQIEGKGKPNKSVQFKEELTDVKEFITYEQEKALRKREKSSRKKRKDNQENGEAILLESSTGTETGWAQENIVEATMEVIETEMKKKKRKKDKKTEVVSTDAEAQAGVVEPKMKKEKKGKKKKKEEAVAEEVTVQSRDEGALKEKKKKKKKKNIEENETTDRDQAKTAIDEEIPKEEASITLEVTPENRLELFNTISLKNDANAKTMKKKRKKQLQQEGETTSTNSIAQVENTKKRKYCENEENSSIKKVKIEPLNLESDTASHPEGKYPEKPNFSYLMNSVKPEKIKKAVANYNFADFKQFKGSNLYAITGYGH